MPQRRLARHHLSPSPTVIGNADLFIDPPRETEDDRRAWTDDRFSKRTRRIREAGLSIACTFRNAIEVAAHREGLALKRIRNARRGGRLRGRATGGTCSCGAVPRDALFICRAGNDTRLSLSPARKGAQLLKKSTQRHSDVTGKF